MATDLPNPVSDVQLLHDFLGKALAGDVQGLTLDGALSGFQDYYLQLRDLRSKIQQANDSLSRGEGTPLDVAGVITRVRQQLAEQGITG
jgi:hypothetical protein